MNSTLFELSDYFYSTSLILHRHFDETFWHQPSYHNADHMRAVWEAAKRLLTALPDADPTGVLPSLQSWNRLHQADFTFTDLYHMSKIALASHDLGNIAQASDYQHNGFTSSGFYFFETYQAHGAEERSVEVFKSIQAMPFLDEPRSVDLIVHLIGETNFSLTDAPFGLFMRVIDQLSSTFFRNSFETEVGLLYEWVAEEPDKTFNPYRHFNFGHFRMRELLSEAQIEKVCEIWGVAVPELDESYPDEKVKVVDFLTEKNRIATKTNIF